MSAIQKTSQSARQPPPELSARPRLVAVEDDRDFLFLLEEWLEPLYDVVPLPHGSNLQAEFDVLQPELVILDVAMPGVDGLSLCRRLRADPRIVKVPILVLTGMNEGDPRAASLEAGATDYLAKPVGREALREKIQSLLAQAKTERADPVVRAKRSPPRVKLRMTADGAEFPVSGGSGHTGFDIDAAGD